MTQKSAVMHFSASLGEGDCCPCPAPGRARGAASGPDPGPAACDGPLGSPAGDQRVDEGRGATWAWRRVLSAPDFVSGLEAAEHSFVSEEWGRTHFPEKCARLNSMRRAFNHLERGGSLLLSFSRQLSPDARIVEQGEASERAAQKALEAISKYRGLLSSRTGGSLA